jgi:integrase
MATIDKRTDSKGNVKYRVRWRLGGTRTGEWQSATLPRLKGERGAEKFKARVEAAGHQWPQDADGALSVPGTITMEQLAAAYLEDRARRVRSDRTPADYRRDIDNWILPHFGKDTMVDAMTEGQVQAWVDGMADGSVRKPVNPSTAPLAPKTVGDRHSLLFAMFDYAAGHDRKWVTHNPCAGTDLPKRQKKKPKGMRPAEWAALHAALRQIDADAADLALFLLASGWRWSEASALSTYDVEDYGDDGVYVNMAQVVRRNAAGQHVIVEEGKGEASLRRIKLDDEAAAMVSARTSRATPGGLVFTTGVSGQNGLGGSQWHYSNFLTRYWNPAVKAANLGRRPTPHWLRHTAVVWLSLAGASLAELQARIGHESIQTTIGVYGSMLTDVQPQALAGFAAMRQGRMPEAPKMVTGQ